MDVNQREEKTQTRSIKKGSGSFTNRLTRLRRKPRKFGELVGKNSLLGTSSHNFAELQTKKG
jgi:hypothetical protein